MKKFLFTLIVAIALFFNGTLEAMASTLHCTSNENAKVELSLSTDEGYIGALDTTIKLSGDVSLDELIWNEELSSDYVKKYTYQKESNTIRIYVATGDTSKNLVSSDGKIHLGLIKVKSEKDNISYDFSIQKLNVSNMDYSAKEVGNLTTASHPEFVYNVIPTVDDKDDDQNSPGDQEENNNDQDQSNSSDHQGNDPSQKPDDNKDEDSDTTLKPGDDSSSESKPSDQDDQEDNKYSNTVVEDDSNGLFPMVIGGTLAVVIIGGVIFYLCKKI